MATVTVPAEFFRGELRVYGDWREAFARELLQNSCDARPTRIDVTFEDVDGHGRVTVTDDGCGMTRETLEEVFFALGRTTKHGADSIGGFGRARIIICFAQTRYEIRTANLHVKGKGGEYVIAETSEHVDGCRFTVDVLDEDVSRVKYAFEALLRTCTIDVPVTFDGTPADQRTMPARATRVMRDADGAAWARVFVSEGCGRLLARVHGLTMFYRWLAGYDDVIVEILPARSREVLSASRDALHTVYGEQIDRFVSDLTRNRRQALRPADTPLDVRVGGGGFLVSDGPVTPEPVPESPAGSDEARAGVRVTPANAAAFAHAVARPVRGGWPSGEDEPESSGLGFDIWMMADTSDTRVRRLARTWDPTGWDGGTGQRRKALLCAWKTAVSFAVDCLLDTQDQATSLVWTVGWTFDRDTRAMHRHAPEGHVFALNPVDDNGSTAYKLSGRQDRQRLLAVALHEVCHSVVDGHDEQFASLLTDMHSRVDMVGADRAIRRAAQLATRRP